MLVTYFLLRFVTDFTLVILAFLSCLPLFAEVSLRVLDNGLFI